MKMNPTTSLKELTILRLKQNYTNALWEKPNEFIVTIDSQPYFFLFHRTFKDANIS